MFRNPRSAALMGYDGPQPGRANVTTTGGERLAGAGSKNFLEQLAERLGGAGNTRKAGGPQILQRVKTVGKVGVPLVGLQLLGSAIAAGQEFNDPEGSEDSAGVNMAQAGGRFVGDLGSNLALAGLGAVTMGPVGAVGLPVLASLLGVQEGIGKGGAGLAEAIYTGVTGDSEARRKASRYRQETELHGERLTQLAPIYNTIAKMQDQRELAMARQAAEIQSDYNFANNLNDQSLMLRQNSANALNIALQNLL